MEKFGTLACAVVLASGLSVHAEGSFPVSYAQRKPAIPGVAPGTTVSRSDPEAARAALPPELAARVAAGEFDVRVQETTDLPPSEPYIEATRRFSAEVRLGSDGRLEGYVAGLPFPAVGPGDPQCGPKAAWNLRHHDYGRGTEAWGIFRKVDSSGRVLREVEFYYAKAYGMHRWPAGDGQNPWADAGILYKEFYQALGPLDVKNLMNLTFRYDDDRRSDDNWAYVPAERKVRKAVAPHEEPTMGTDLLREDYYGFSGYVAAHDWKCLGEATVLAPVGIRAARPTLSPEGYPADPWEPREALVVEATPKNPHHPYGRRVLYVDRQMWVVLYSLIFDRSGAHAKTLFVLYGNPKYSPGNEAVRVPIWLGEAVRNHQTGEATTSVITRAVFDTAIPEDRFTIDHMLALGR
jgi:hypothetical protein